VEIDTTGNALVAPLNECWLLENADRSVCEELRRHSQLGHANLLGDVLNGICAAPDLN